MNERIRELADQILPNEKEFHQGDPKEWGYFFTGEELEKFAELIVRECVDIIQRESEKAIRNNTYMGDDVPASVTQWKIKEHFGV
jgi:hypothetical protein